MKTLILFINLFLFTSCDNQSNSGNYASEAYRNLNKNIELWKASKVKDYSFVIKKSCFCPYEENKLITVSNGTVKKAKYIPSNTVINISSKEKVIDAYFDIIQEALDENAYKLTVSYDKTYGYPSDIAIDYDKNMVDEEMYYTLSHFQSGNSNAVCTEQYIPVCARVDIECVTTPCEAIEETFSNICHLNANPNATYLRDGEC